MSDTQNSRSNDETGTGQVMRTAAAGALGADYNIQTNDPSNRGRPCRRIQVAVAGTLVVKGVDGTNVTVPSGINTLDIQAIMLVAAGTTAQGIVVTW